MGTSALIVALIAASTTGASIPGRTVAKQNKVFQKFWGTEFVWKFDDLPTKGAVSETRVPYSGYIYPDTAGGTANALRKYDRAFHRGRTLATSHEHWDTNAYKKPARKRGGLLGLRMRTVMETPNWHGHCNGWAAAAIRHAEPQNSVRRNGVVFSPADIKGLLAEIYMYNDLDHLLGLSDGMNAGAFHAILANWLGRGTHPLGMEADPGEEKWNYPVYGFACSAVKRSSRVVEVKTNIAYAKDSNGEHQESPRINRIKYFHYQLNLNDEGEIIGGYFYRDSSMIDMLWVPLRPKKSREKGNEPGNPYVDVDEVLAIWRDSVPEDVRKKWLIIDPTEKDRVLDIVDAGDATLVPLQTFPVATTATEVATAEDGTSEDQPDMGEETAAADVGDENESDTGTEPIADDDAGENEPETGTVAEDQEEAVDPVATPTEPASHVADSSSNQPASDSPR